LRLMKIFTCLKKNHSFLFLFSLVIYHAGKIKAQSDNCATATPITIGASTTCVNGTTVGGTVDNITTTCNGSPVNFVWYQFTSTGTQNQITLTPGTLQNAVMVVDASGCNDGFIDFCNNATGSNPITILNSQPVGTTIIVSIASTSNTQGTFSLCVNSYTPTNPSAGDDCSNAIPYCSGANLNISDMSGFTGSPKPSCFIGPGSNPTQDMFISFTVYQNGTIAWTANPSSNSTEYDWAIFNTTSGCGGTQVGCNYNWGGETGLNFGMSTGGTGEFNTTINATVGQTYVIQISNWSGDGTGFVFSWQGTAAISPTANFSITPTFSCGTSATVNITNSSTGTPNWTFGNGNTYTGTTPPSQTYTATGTYAITATIPGACPATFTQYFSLYGPLAATVTSTSVACAGMCTGTASVSSVSGGNGIYTYSWTPGGSTSTNISGLCPGTYTVKVSNAFCGTNVTNTVTVVAPPAMTVTVNSPTICKNATVTLTAGGATTYSWTPGTGLSATTGASVTANPTVTTTYTVVGTTGSCTAAATAVVTVNPTPTITVNSPTICKNATVTLTAGGASTYTWSPGTGLSGTTGTSVTANPTVTTTYTITGTSVAGCTATATSTVTVNPTPTITVNSPTICKTATVTLTAGGASTYTWSPGTGLSGTTGTSVTANPTVTTTYTITGTSVAGCTATATSTVTVNPTPTVTVNSPTICVNASTTLNAGGASTYSWSPATGLSGTTGASVTANPTVTTTYTITGTSAATCTAIATSTVTVNPTPTITVGSATMCPGNSTTLTATGASTYTWSPGTGLSGTTGASVTANPTVTTTYTITGTSVAGCTATATSTVTIGGSIVPSVNSATICLGQQTATLTATGGTTYTWSPGTGLSSTSGASVTANPTVTTSYTITAASGGCTGTTTAMVTVNPIPTVTVNSPSICVNASTTLNAGGASTYTWSPGTGLSGTTGASVTANPTVTTTYTVTGTSVAGCTATATSTVTVNPVPTVTVNNATYCTGGSATLNAGGASTYTWSPGTGLSATTGASVTANPTVTTNYTVTGTSAAGCVNTATTSVTVVTNPTITVNTATFCIGASATLTANGAVTYTWSPGTGLSSTTGASVTANPTVTTTYTISGSAGTCTAVATTTVTVNPLPIVTVNSGTICIGNSTTLNAGGASTYTWSPGTGLSSTTGASVTANPTVTTNYTVTGTSAAGCVNTATTVVTVNPLPTLTVNNATYCTGGSAVLTAGGASTYSWSPGTGLSSTTGASVTANPTVTTNYTVTGTDANGCVNTNTTSITVVTNPTITVNTATFCIGASATLTANGAVTYTWSPGTGLSSTSGTSVTANPTVTTTYTISGSAGTCTAVATTTVTVNPLPIVTVNSGTICVGQQTATLTAGGASTYSWSPATGLSSSTGTSVNATPTTTTSYTVTGTDANGCVNTATTAVTVNPLPTLTLNSGFICNGSTATLTATGASTYSWSPGTGLSSTSGSSVTGNPASTTQYTVTGTDANGCFSSDTTSITVVNNPTVTVNAATICIGDSATLTATGAQTYVWSPATGLSSTSGTSVTANPTATTTYTITGTAGTCTAVATTTVTVNPLPLVTVNSGTICLGQQTATLTAGGASTYSWSPATGLSSSTGTSVNATPTTTTSYTVTGTDANGCVNTATTAVTVNPLPTLTLNSGFICNGSTATLTATGASTYSWSPATGLSSTSGSSVTGNPASTTQYTVTGTDANGCFSSDTTSITVVNNPTVTVNAATICIGDSATLTATGAQTYVWSPATGLSSTSGTSVTANPTTTTVYTITGTAGTCTAVATTTVTVNPLPLVTVNSGTICVGQQTATLTAGGASTYSWSPATGLCCTTGAVVTGTPTTTTSYTVTGTDINGCVNTATASITVNPLPVLTLNSGFICLGGSTTLNAGGATTYNWSPGTGLSSTTGSSVNANPSVTTNYTVVGTDANGCINADTTSVIVVNNPTVTVNAATICIGDSATLTATGAQTYVWSPGTDLSSTSGTSVTANPTVTTTYTITGTAGTCTAVATTTVTVNPLPVIVAGSNSPLCVNQNLNLNASGGTGYSWSGPNSFSSSSQNPSVNGVTTADGGIYTVTVTDANTCVNTQTVSVIVNPLPVVTVTGATVCVNQTINITCNNSGVTYSWTGPNTFSSNQQNPSIPNATTAMSGNYVVTVTDANNCASGNVASVLVNPSLVINATNNGPVCENAMLVLATGSGVSWSWSGPNGFSSVSQTPTIPNAQVNASGTYTVVGTDANGCTGTATTTALVNPLPIITVNSGTICVTQQTATLTAAGAVTYSWSPANSLSSATGSSVNANPMVSTVYTITGTDANGCNNSTTSTVTVNQLPTVTSNSGTICLGSSTTLTGSGAVSYSWTPSTGLSSSSASPVTANPTSSTAYTITGTDANGCYNTGVCSVTVNPLPNVSVNPATICSGASATLNALGANTYSWSPAAGLTASTGASVSANPSSSSTYIVTGTDINGCANTDTALVTVNPLPVLNVDPQNASGCSPVCVSLSNTSSASGTCSWNFGDGSSSTNCAPAHCYIGQGTFYAVLTLTDANGCVGSDSAIVVVYPIPDADFDFGPQPASIYESTIQFTDASTGAIISNWNWTFGDPQNSSSTVQNPAFNYGDPGSYNVQLAVTSNYGCTDSITKTVVIDPEFMIYVPNAFTPNFDGVNDVFMAKGEGIKDFQLFIFDRWGNQVFFSDDIMKGWDGRFQAKGEDIVQEDVYVWKIELKNFKNEPKQMKGTVSLIK